MAFYSGWFGSSGFDAATPSKKRQSHSNGRSQARDEDSHLLPPDRQRLTLELADLRRNVSLIYGVLDRFGSFVVNTGIVTQAKTSDSEWNVKAEAYFSEWEKVCDSRRRLHFWEIQRLAIRSLFTDGECCFVLKDNGQINPIEAARIQTPTDFTSDEKVVQGIRLGGDGIAVGYYVCNRGKNGYVNYDDYTYINADSIIHLVSPDRFDQLRGIPIIASLVNTVRDMDEFRGYTIGTAKLQALQAMVLTSKRALPNGPYGIKDADGTTAASDDRSIKSIPVGTDGATIYTLPTDAELKLLANMTPNSQYKDFNQGLLEEIACGLSVPVEILTLNFKSGQVPKAAVTMAIKTFERYQKLLTSKLINRLWNWRIAKAMKEGDLGLAPLDDAGVSQWYKVTYQLTAGWDFGDGSEDQSSLIQYNMGTKSLSEISRKQGKEFEDTLDAKVSEIEMAIIKAKAINAKHGTNLSFRELIVSQNPGQFSAAQTKQQEAETGTKQGEKQ